MRLCSPSAGPAVPPGSMHWLEVLSLCCLAAAALLPGPRAPAAAFQSGHGYDEEEPEAGEAKVSPGPAGGAGSPLWPCARPSLRTGTSTGEKMREKPLDVGRGFLEVWGRNYF